MKYFRNVQLAVLAGLVACAQIPTKDSSKVSDRSFIKRTIAATDSLVEDNVADERVTKITDGLYHSYLLGQSHIEEFDKLLDKDPAAAMKSSTYSTLLAIRTYVDKYEHELEDLQLGLNLYVLESTENSPNYANAKRFLGKIENFIKGIRTDSSEIPENLKPLILTNLQQSQIHVYEKVFTLLEQDGNYSESLKEELKTKYNGAKLTNFSGLSTYKIDSSVVKEALKAERKKNAFKEFEAEIQKQSKQMKEYISDVGRDTSSAGIIPSTGRNGNISGGTFPKNTWSLTFDDGPGKTTEQLVTNLLQKKVPATFFMLAKQVETFPKTVSRINNEGFDIASHSYTHAQLTKVGPAQLEKEIGGSKKTIEAAIGKPVKLFRLPYGAGVSVSNVRAKIAEHNMVHVFWTVDTLDWQDKNPSSILVRALKQMNGSGSNSGIILFHDIHSQSVTASTMLMDYFNSKQLTVCTVQGVVNQMNNDLSSCK